MNDVLQLKGRFEQRKNTRRPGAPSLPDGQAVLASHINNLADQLSGILAYWRKNDILEGALVSVHYQSIVAKSNRLKILLSEKSQSPTESIRGAKFAWEKNILGKVVQKHVFTHYVSLEAIDKSVKLLNMVASDIDKYCSGSVNNEKIAAIKANKQTEKLAVSYSAFQKAIVDAFYVERFDIDRASRDVGEDSIITIYKTARDTKKLLSELGINIFDERILDETTLRLNQDEAKILYDKAPYLIAMSVKDFSALNKEDIIGEVNTDNPPSRQIPMPSNEPIIGVIDTQFDEKVYFHEWVEYENMLDPAVQLVKEDFYHGTSVSYIIVDGPKGNPNLDDGCGRFRVKHYGVATHNGFSSFSVLRCIRRVVAQNRDIKVWNLSLGSMLEINQNFISPEAAELDRIQSEYDVIFVVAGTNKPVDCKKNSMKIGAPADSLNSVVVNAVNFAGKSASYTRVGPVLSFFHKPDVSYYGGDGNLYYDKIAVCNNDMGAMYVKGTSYAAPWIARKLAYLIHIMGLSREAAKALLIDSAAGWNRKDDVSHSIGYGIVPKHINDIIKSADDEIRFILTGVSEEYETYTYNLSFPIVNSAYPFYAKVTLVYFPNCDRYQGVDYTNTEMDVHFGRLRIGKKDVPEIKPIDNNYQSENMNISLYEADARKMYRKWDNVKHISEKIKAKGRARKAYEFGLWGLRINTKERMQKRKEPLPFGVVITLKEMNGVNRLDDFIKLNMARGWIVHRLDVENRIDIYVKSEEEIHWS